MEYNEMGSTQRFFIRIARKVLGLEGNKNKINWLKTLYFNFRTMPWDIARHLPIYLYGKFSFINLDGKVLINAPIKSGMIKLGLQVDLFSCRQTSIINLPINAQITFHGHCKGYTGTIIRLESKACLDIGSKVIIGSKVKICCADHIYIGNNSAIAFESQLIDTNFHYVINYDNGKVKRRSSPIIIGKSNWIGNRTTVMHNTITPDNCIIGSNSLLNKNYEGRLGHLIAGAPAIIHSEKDYRKIVQGEYEQMLDTYFAQHPNESSYQFEHWTDLNLFDGTNIFK